MPNLDLTIGINATGTQAAAQSIDTVTTTLEQTSVAGVNAGKAL